MCCIVITVNESDIHNESQVTWECKKANSEMVEALMKFLWDFLNITIGNNSLLLRVWNQIIQTLL